MGTTTYEKMISYSKEEELKSIDLIGQLLKCRGLQFYKYYKVATLDVSYTKVKVEVSEAINYGPLITANQKSRPSTQGKRLGNESSKVSYFKIEYSGAIQCF